MARPSKYSSELVKRFTQYVADGLTMRDACYGVGISADTLSRWRKEKPEFNEAIAKATEAQAWSSLVLARTSEYRRYTRKAKHYQKQTQNEPQGTGTYLEQNKAILGLLKTPHTHYDRQLRALPRRSNPPVDEFGRLMRCEPYLNTANDRVEWVEGVMFGKCVLHSCPSDIWSKNTYETNTRLSI